MTYLETIDYLFTRLPLFSRMGPAAFKKDLTNIRQLCAALGEPQQQFKTIHVGGTNGKGSTSHLLAAVLQSAGYKTGLYTSPHLYDFRERIRLNGSMISESFVVEFVEQLQPLIEELSPSFFEITVAMAFAYFAAEKVDVAIIEVGLGGRLDSTNIITPVLSVITNIGWDHMNLLGNTLPVIAAEKAGIIKPGVPVVIGEHQAETDPVFLQKAADLSAPLHFAENEWQLLTYEWNDNQLSVTYNRKATSAAETYITELTGIYQTRNLATVLAAVTHLQQQGFQISAEALTTGLSQVRKLTGLQGRWEVIWHEPQVILEVAHNPEGIRQMLHHLQTIPYQQLHIVFGMVKDKDPESVLRLLPSAAQYYFTQAQIPRALPAAELTRQAQEVGLSGNSYPEVNEALEAAISQASRADLVIVCGSIFLVAEVDKDYFSKEDSSFSKA